jgi:purine nucleosidase
MRYGPVVRRRPTIAGRRTLLDTDVGTNVDDAIALALVCASPELDLRAVTTVSGDTVLRARIASRLLSLGGLGHVPVAAGLREPSSGAATFRWLGHEGAGIVDGTEPVADVGAVDLMIETLRRDRLDVVAIGPLTNLAAAIARAPDVVSSIRHLTIMGGRLGRDPGAPAVEYNLASDPDASVAVLSAGIPTTLVPLDVTWRVAFTPHELRRLRESEAGLAQTLCDAIERWARIRRTPGVEGMSDDRPLAVLHDPLTVAVLLDPSLVTWERQRLRPASVGGGFRLVDDGDAPEVEVAVAVDADRAVEVVIGRLLAMA